MPSLLLIHCERKESSLDLLLHIETSTTCFVLVIIFINFKQSGVLHRSNGLITESSFAHFFLVINSYILSRLEKKKGQVILRSFPV